MIFKGIEIYCPLCSGNLCGSDHQDDEEQETSLRCVACRRQYPVVLGVPDLRVLPDPYIEPEADRQKGLRLASRSADLSFAQLVDYYYSITPDVPASRAHQYKSGLYTGERRARAALRAWEESAGRGSRPSDASFLEVGCGSGPLLVAAAAQFPTVVGVDIAFRWLVVAKRRLAEAGLDLPLICASAEALPFRDGSYDRVAVDSTLEHTWDQRKTLEECWRVMRPAGHLFVATPNRYSLGPDPHLGIWAGGYLPSRWLAEYARRRGMNTPRRRLLSARALRHLIEEAGFTLLQVTAPDVSPQGRERFGWKMRALIDLYSAALRVPGAGQAALWVGPLVHAVAEKATGRSIYVQSTGALP